MAFSPFELIKRLRRTTVENPAASVADLPKLATQSTPGLLKPGENIIYNAQDGTFSVAAPGNNGEPDGNKFPTAVYLEDATVLNIDQNDDTTIFVDLADGIRSIAGMGYYDVQLDISGKRLVFYGTGGLTIVDIASLFGAGGGSDKYVTKFSLRANTSILQIQLNDNTLLPLDIAPLLAYKLLANNNIVTTRSNEIISTSNYNTITSGSGNKILGASTSCTIHGGQGNVVTDSNTSGISESILCSIKNAYGSNIQNSNSCKIEYDAATDTYNAHSNTILNSFNCSVKGQRNNVSNSNGVTISGACLDVAVISSYNLNVTGGGSRCVYINCSGDIAGAYGTTYINNIPQPKR